MTLTQVIDCGTCHAADGLRLNGKGRLVPGQDADLTIFDVKQETCLFSDSDGQTLSGETHLVPLAAVVSGQAFVTNEGKKRDDFSV